MRRNNCWLAVLAVSTVLPILRHGLARERFPLDQEDTELKANRSKAAYVLDQTTPSVRTEEIDFASRNDATKLVLDASPLDQPSKKCTIVDDASKAIPQGGCIGIEDADTSAQSYSVDQSQLDSRLASSFSVEDSRKRSAGAQTISEWTMAAGNSENSGERRLSTWISRGAVERTSERTRGVIHGDGAVRTATTSGRKRGTLAQETNRWGTRYGDRGASHYSHVEGSSRDDDSLTTLGDGERNFAGNRPLGGSDGGSSTGSSGEIGAGEESSMGGDVDDLSERGYGDRRQYEDFPTGISELDLESRESEGLGERRGVVGGVEFLSLEEKLRKRKDQSVYNLMDGGVRLRDLDYERKPGVASHDKRKMSNEPLHFWRESRNHSGEGKGSFEETTGQTVARGSVDPLPPSSSLEGGNKLVESKLDYQEQKLTQKSIDLNSSNGNYQENQIKSETLNFLSTSMPPSRSSEGGSRLRELKFQEQEVDKGSMELRFSDYQENQVKFETLDFLSTSMPPSSSLEGGNKLVASKLDHQEQKLTQKSIDLSSPNGNYQQSQIKSEILNFLSTSMPPSSSLEGGNKLVESKLDHQEQKLTQKSTDLSSSNGNYQENQIKSEILNFLSTSMPPSPSLEGGNKLVESKLDHQGQKLTQKSIDLSSPNGNYQQNQIKSATLDFQSSSMPPSSLRSPPKLADLHQHRLSKRSVDPSSDRLETPLKAEISPVRFDPSPSRSHPLASSSQEANRERYNSAGIENPERVPTSRKSAEVYRDGSLELRDVSPEQRSTANNDVPEDNAPTSSNQVAFPVPRTAIEVSAVERARGNLAFHTPSKDEVTFTEESAKLANAIGSSYPGESRSTVAVNNGVTDFHFSGDSDAKDMLKKENVGSREDRGLPRVEIQDGKEDWTWGKAPMEESRKDVSNGGAGFNFPEINVAGNLSKRDNLTLNTMGDDNRDAVEKESRYSEDRGGDKVWIAREDGKVTLMEQSREEVSNSGADFNFPEINGAGNLSKLDNLTLIEDKVTLIESTKLTNGNGNSPVNSLNSRHPSFRATGTFDRKTNNPPISAEDPPEGSKTPSPIDPVVINSKENQRSSPKITNKNNNSSVKSLNSTHPTVPTTGTFDTKTNNPTIPTISTQDPLEDPKTPDDPLTIKSRGSQRSSIEAHDPWIPPTPPNTGENDDEIKLPEARVVDQTLSGPGQRSISLAGTSSAVVENREERRTTSRVPPKLNGPLTNDPVIVFKDVASRTSRDSSNQNSRLSAHGIKDNEPAVGFPSGERVGDVAGDGQGAETIDEVNLAESGNGDLAGISKSVVDSVRQSDSRGNVGNSGPKLGTLIGKLGNSRLGASPVIETGNVEERTAESSRSSLKTGLNGALANLGNQVKGGARDPIEGSIGSIEEFLSTKEDETLGGPRVKGKLPEQEDETIKGDVAAVVKDGIKDPMDRESKDSIEEHEGTRRNRTLKKMVVENFQSSKEEDQSTQVGLDGIVEGSIEDPMNRESKSSESSKEMRVENLQSSKQEDQRTHVGLAETVEESIKDPMNRESKSSESSKKMRVENLGSVKQENQRTQVGLAEIVKESIKDPMNIESKSSESSKKMRVENLGSVKQEDQSTQDDLAEIVKESIKDPMNRESKISKSSKEMRVENLQSSKQGEQRTQVGLDEIVEGSIEDPMNTESKSSKSSKEMRVENLQSYKQGDKRTQVGLAEVVKGTTHDPLNRESKSSIEESLGLGKDETLGNPRAKDLPPTKQDINTTVNLPAALNKTLNPMNRHPTSSTDLPSLKNSTSLKTEVLQQKFGTQVNPALTKPKNIDNPPSQSVFADNLRTPEQRTSESPTKQRRDSSGFPAKSEVPSSVLDNEAPNVTSAKIESFPFENRAPAASVLDRQEFIAQGRATITSTMDETTSPGTTSFDEDVPFETTESSRMDAGASIASTTDMDRLVYLGIGEDRITTVANVSQGGGDNSSHELEYQWPVKHSAVVEGDLVLGGLMMVHEREDRMTCGPVMPQGGVQAVEAMLYTLDWLNEQDIVPGVKIGAHILDDCDKDTYGLEMAVDFIKGSISNIDGAEYHCNKTAVRKVISGVVGAASSVTSIQVANLLRLFRIPQVSFFSTSPELSNKQRFEYFTRTIPSDHYQVKAMVDIVLRMGWSYVSIIYEESNYGIKAFEELEELLGKYDICIAIKEKLVKDSGVAGETAYDNIVLKLLTKPRAKGCIIYASDQEVAELMRAVRRCNATGAFSWIGSDGWSARGLVSNGNEPEVEGTLSVQPQANPIKGFKEYFLNLTVENNRRNPWFVEFWEDHFQCRYPNASLTPYNKRYTKPCTTKERLTAQNTAVEDQLQFVSDAVMAFAYAFRDIHKRLCREHPKNCGHMNPTNGTELLQYLREVEFEGLSGDKFKFDKNGDGPARYNIIHFKQTEPGKYKWVRVGKYLEGELRLNMSEIQFKLGHPQPPDSVCALPCEVGQAKKYVEGERCCWHCFNCTQYQIRHPKDETQCIQCRQGTVPDETHSTCRDIPQEFLRPESGWAIGAMSFSATGMLITFFVCGVFLKHNDTPVVRASGRELSYVLLSGILLCYLVTFALVMKPTDIVCGIQRFAAGFCFTVVYAALLTKTNRISRIFNASKHSAKRPSFISPRSQLIICSGLVSVQILINGVWMIIDPAKAMHHYPTREDNLLVCNSYVDASYMIAFAYPIMLIVVCTVYAVLTRKIPEAFNESKHIGFTMYTTCVIWLAFVPLYFGTGNNVALRITSMSVTISLSASVTIACLFSPKLYIILIRPERNVRQSMMPARYNTTKSSAVTATNASSMIAPVTLTAATCDQNKTVKRHIINTIDCSTQSEYYELEVKDQKNGKPPATVVSRSTQTCTNNDKDSSGVVAGKDSKENSTTTTKENTTTKQINNNARIGNGPVNQTDVTL